MIFLVTAFLIEKLYILQSLDEKVPLLVWLQGFSKEDGLSSMFGMFEEIGPFAIDSSLNVTEKEHSWTSMMNLLFIDQPVGTGFR